MGVTALVHSLRLLGIEIAVDSFRKGGAADSDLVPPSASVFDAGSAGPRGGGHVAPSWEEAMWCG